MSSRILVVDDEPEIRQLFADILGPRGYRVALAASGSEAIAHATADRFDIIFLDIKMPGMNGVETLEAMRRVNPHARCVMITGWAGSELVDQSLADGALLCLNKPFGVADILDIVRTLEQQHAVPK